MTPEEEELVTAIQRADPSAAETLYRKMLPTIRGTLWRFSANRADHDDLVQITFERVIVSLVEGRFKGNCTLASWTASISAHAVIDHLRAHTRERRVFVSDESETNGDAASSPTPSPEREVSARLELRDLRSVLSRMKPRDAQALLLRHGYGYTVGEVASALGSSEAAVASRLMRAQRELRRRTAKRRGEETVAPEAAAPRSVTKKPMAVGATPRFAAAH